MVNLWGEASKKFDFSKKSRNDHAYQEIAKKLVALGIHQASAWCRERIKWLKTDDWKARDENHTSGNLLSHCTFYEELDQVLGTVPSTEPPALHDSLASWGANLLIHESSGGMEGASRRLMRLVLKPVPEEAAAARHGSLLGGAF